MYVGSKQKSFGPPFRPISHAAYPVFEMGQGCEKKGSKKLGALKSKSTPIVCKSKTVSGLAALDLDGSDGPIPGHGAKGPRIGPAHLYKSIRASVGTPLSISPMEKIRAPDEKPASEEGAFTAREDKEKELERKEKDTIEQRYVLTDLPSSAHYSSPLFFGQALNADGLFGTGGRSLGVESLEDSIKGDKKMLTPLQAIVVYEDVWEENPRESLGVPENWDGRDVFQRNEVPQAVNHVMEGMWEGQGTEGLLASFSKFLGF